MIAEIVTYKFTLLSNGGKYKEFLNKKFGFDAGEDYSNIELGIMFVEGSPQAKELKERNETIKSLIKKYKINVFQINKRMKL